MSTAITSYISLKPTYTMTLVGVDKDFDVKELCYVLPCNLIFEQERGLASQRPLGRPAGIMPNEMIH